MSTVVLLLGVCTALAMPLDAVWCRGSSGHSALELAWSACCAPADGGASCTGWSAPFDPAPGSPSLAPGDDWCADLWLGGPVAVSPSPIAAAHWLHAIPTHEAIPAIPSGPAGPLGARASTPHPRQLRDLITTTVLTI
jgi:hypothetical protein